jgi:hypothetical protein
LFPTVRYGKLKDADGTIILSIVLKIWYTYKGLRNATVYGARLQNGVDKALFPSHRVILDNYQNALSVLQKIVLVKLLFKQ